MKDQELKNEQEKIRDWFNSNYERHGFDYLRPQQAYEIFIRYLQESTDSEPANKYLDVACGLGLMLKTAQDNGYQATGVDISSEAIRVCQEFVPNAETKVANAEKLPFADGEFDFISCLGSLERMVDLEQVLAELMRVGHKNSRYCFLVRNSATLVWRIYRKALGRQNKQGHQDAKNYNEWNLLFENAGFEVITVRRDHWPWMRIKHWLSFGIFPVDYQKPPLDFFPLQWATEFVYILKQKNVHS